MLPGAVMKTWLARAVFCLALIDGCATDPGSGAPEKSIGGAGNAASTPVPGQDWFTEAAAESGLHFAHFNGASGRFYYPEILPPGVALFDFDNDSDLDIYMVQGRSL